MPANAQLNVLIVDDYQDTATTFAMMLQREGFNARAVCKPTEVAQALIEFVPDILITDVAMPDIDGYELAAQVRKAMERKPLLIAITGYDKVEERSRSEGFDYHFLKPCDPNVLIAMILEYAQKAAG